MTGQPDFAHIVIDYVPDQTIVESKSLKLFLGSFRNHGAFHEDCTLAIAKRLVDLLSPVWLRIGAYGIQEAAFQSTFSGRRVHPLPAFGCLIRGCRLTAGEGEGPVAASVYGAVRGRTETGA